MSTRTSLPRIEMYEESETLMKPELDIRKAILDRAISDYLESAKSCDRQYIRDAKRWLFCKDKKIPKDSPNYWPYTFLEICSDLELDHELIRLYVRRAKKQILKFSRQSRRPTFALLSAQVNAVMSKE